MRILGSLCRRTETAPAPCNISDAVEPEEYGQAGRAGWRAGTVPGGRAGLGGRPGRAGRVGRRAGWDGGQGRTPSERSGGWIFRRKNYLE